MKLTKPVLIDAGTGLTLTYAQLLRRVERARSRQFRRRLVAFCLPNSAAWFVRFLAIQQSGGTAVPLDPSLSSTAQERTARKISAHYLWRARSLRKLTPTPGLISDVWCVKVTSGTTGDLQAIHCAAKNMQADGEHIIQTMGIGPDDCNLAVIPLGHSYGLGNLVMPLLLQGTTVVCAAMFVPRQILQLIEEYKVTVLPTVPAVLRALAQLDGATKPSSLRLVISAGAPLSTEVARQFYRRYRLKIHNFYGSSETGGICYDRTGDATLSGRSVGQPLAGVTVRLRKDGRVAVRSRAGNALLPDVGEWNQYGELRLLGRVGQIANIGGKKVSPLEVERALRSLRGIQDVWVTVLKDKHGNDFLAAAVETGRSQKGIEIELERSLPAWKLPKAFLLAAALPRSDRGKLHTERLELRLKAMT
ncbi:MAG TPA: class I adenylate-forming enzyme family protein [Verrucomicrobiae bacterium]|nr:class I adenylate-forming enzyme family protein [Verrucomicrobiae bacterium]